MIIGLSGKTGAGKDTVAQILVEEFGYKRVAFADKIKECLLALDPAIWTNPNGLTERLSGMIKMMGWEQAKQHPEVRRLLQRMGTEVGREILGGRTWINQVFYEINVDPFRNWVVTDVRFVNEAAITNSSIKDRQLWRIERDLPAINNHASETELDNWQFDKVIENNGTLEELAIKVREAMG